LREGCVGHDSEDAGFDGKLGAYIDFGVKQMMTQFHG
jgi:hypothetical protein